MKRNSRGQLYVLAAVMIIGTIWKVRMRKKVESLDGLGGVYRRGTGI